ncbi:hypothetical protein IQ255_29715 [Pleurocapsales cyanobacterium LEGE 10410]|nr:hypothetical protein [Pleurocapsales cyanobacterium LEGE 10410]
MNLAIVYTEYQLIQVQAIIKYRNLNGFTLIIVENNRIEDWLIDYDIFKCVLRYSYPEVSRKKRVFKKYIQFHFEKISEILNGNEVELMIGAQDENTIFRIFMQLAKPKIYWNIEDGIANYYERDIKFKTGILLKNLLFKYVYGFDLKIQYRHGLDNADKKFRMAPEIANETNDIEELAPIFKNYLIDKANENLIQNINLSEYRKYNRLIITNLSQYNKNRLIKNGKEEETSLYKFHPSEKIPNDIGVEYMDEKIPLELVLILLKNIKIVEFHVMSSSYLNLKKMNFGIQVIDNIGRESKINKFLLSKFENFFFKIDNSKSI